MRRKSRLRPCPNSNLCQTACRLLAFLRLWTPVLLTLLVPATGADIKLDVRIRGKGLANFAVLSLVNIDTTQTRFCNPMNGHFVCEAVPPGRYRILANIDSSTALWFGCALDRQDALNLIHVGACEVLEVSQLPPDEKLDQEVKLELIPMPKSSWTDDAAQREIQKLGQESVKHAKEVINSALAEISPMLIETLNVSNRFLPEVADFLQGIEQQFARQEGQRRFLGGVAKTTDRLTRASIRFSDLKQCCKPDLPSPKPPRTSPYVRQSVQLIDTCSAGDLPRVDERDLANLLSLSPFASPVEGAQGEAVSVSGQRTWFVRYNADGGEYTNSFFGTPLGGRISMNTESVEEFEVLAPGGTASRRGFGPAEANFVRLQNFGVDGPWKQYEKWYHRVRPAVPFSLSKTETVKSFQPFGGGGNKQCRVEPCPYLFLEYLFDKSDMNADEFLRGDVAGTRTLPAGEASDLSRKSHEIFFKKAFLPWRDEDPKASNRRSFPGHLVTAFQFAVLGNPAVQLRTGDEGDTGIFGQDRLIFHTTSWGRPFGKAHENRLRYTYAAERRTTLDGAFNEDLDVFLPTFGSETSDRFSTIQIADDVTLVEKGFLFSFGADWVHSRNRRKSLDEEDRRSSRISNQNLAFYAQGRIQVFPNLSLTTGLRWEGQGFPNPLIPPQQTLYGPFLSDPEFPSDGTLRSQWDQWQPRLALAWSPDRGRTTFRAGAGRFFARQTLLTQLAALEGTGVDLQSVVQPDPADLTVFSRNYRNPRVDAADFSIEWRPHHSTSFLVDFRYSKGYYLTRFYDINQSDEEEPLPDQANPYYRLPEDGNRVIYTQPPRFSNPDPWGPRIAEILLVESRAKSLYRGVTLSLRKFLGKGWFSKWPKHWQFNASYTYSIDKDNDSSENHLSARPFNRLDFIPDYAVSDRDIRHRVDAFATGVLPWAVKNWVIPDVATLRFQFRTPQPASFDPRNQKSFGEEPCQPFNSATRVVDFIDCGRNHLRLDNGFASFDWGVQWHFKGFENRLFKSSGPLDRASLVLSFEMLNTFDSRNFRRRQDLLQIPFLLEDRKQKRGIRFRAVLYFGGFGRN